MVKKINILIVVFTIILCGCSAPKSPAEISDLIKFEFPEGNTISQNGDLNILIHNYSDKCIVFPVDYGMKIFMKQGKEIIQLKDKINNIGDEIKLEPVGEIYADDFIDFEPDLSSITINDTSEFYATIEGHLCDDDKMVIDKTIVFSVKPN